MKKLLFTLFAGAAGAASFSQTPLDTLSYLNNNPNIYSLTVVRNDKVLYGKYFNGYSGKSLFNDQSLTKSVVAILIGIAIDKGYIKSVDEKIADYFPELNNDPDKRKKEVTIRQVMNQASGLYHEDLTRLGAFLHLPNTYEYVLKAPMVSDPGKEWHYDNAATHLLSVILTKATKKETLQFANETLFQPLGITGIEWKKMRDGYYDGCGLLSIRLHSADLVKLGRLILQHGRYNQQQIVSEKWINGLLKPDIVYPSYWGFDQSTYALCFYHFTYKGTAITYGMGWGGQFLLMIPSQNALVVINENVADDNAIRQSNTFIYGIFPVIFNYLADHTL